MKNTIALSVAGLLAASSFLATPAEAKRHILGHSVRVQTKNNNASAGTAKDIAPDSKQSATGGQPGGLPGQ